MLALHWPSGPWPVDAGLWTLVPSDAGRHRHWSLGALVVFGSGWCEKPARSTADNPTADPTNSPDDYQGLLHKIKVIETVKTRAVAARCASSKEGGVVEIGDADVAAVLAGRGAAARGPTRDPAGCPAAHSAAIHKPSALVSFGLPDPLSFQVRSHAMVARSPGTNLDREASGSGCQAA